MIPLRLYAIAAAVLALGLVLWHDHHQTQRANRLAREKAEVTAQLATANEYAKETERRMKVDAEIRAGLRQSLDDASVRLASIKPPTASVKYVQLPGEPCPSLRLDPEWVRAYDAGSEAAAVPYPR